MHLTYFFKKQKDKLIISIKLLLLIALQSVVVYAQKIDFSNFSKKEVGVFKKDAQKNKIYIPSQFSQDILQPVNELDIDDIEVITQIDLVYTRYKLSEKFIQERLNAKRIENLKNILPQSIINSSTEWRLVEQTDCNNFSEGKNYYHGFVVHYRPKPTQQSRDEELAFVDEHFSEELYENELRKAKATGNYSLGKQNYGAEGFYRDTLWNTSITQTKNKEIADTSLLNILNRNNWNDILLVVDVTGSMSPYTVQVLKWIKNNLENEKIKQIVFFNDGDNLRNELKKIGKTGGVYSTESKKFIEVLSVMRKAMRKGDGGGDGVENDFEAIEQGLKSCKKCNDVVLIADNFENTRDYILLEQIEKPIHIVLCGAKNTINTHFLKIANQFHTSLHTLNDDVVFENLIEGDIIQLKHFSYKYKNGTFLLRRE